jgi:hypothetical protein
MMKTRKLKAEVLNYLKKSPEQIRAELSKGGLDPQRLVETVRELVNARIHHSEDHRRSLHPIETVISIIEWQRQACRTAGSKAA